MKVYEVKKRDERLIHQLIEVWYDSVCATHTFLKESEILEIKKYVPEALSQVSKLVVVKKEDSYIGFMGVNDQKIEMLFLLNAYRNQGIGKELILYGIRNYNVNEVTVNEQNPQAVGFYEHMGFVVYKRSELDEQQNAYPILYMRLK